MKIKTFAIVFCIPLCTHAMAGTPVGVELLANATVKRDLAKTGDVAKVTGGDVEIRRVIAELDISEPKVSGRTTITKSQLGLRLRLAGIPVDAYQITGPEIVRIRWSETEAPPADAAGGDHAIIEMARGALAANWQEAAEDVDVRMTRPLPSNIRSLLDSDPDFRIKPFLPQKVSPGALRLPFGVYRGNSLVNRSVASLEVSLRRRVAIAKRDIGPREPISADAIEFVRRPTQGRIAKTATVDVIGKVATHSVKRGAILTSSDVRSPLAAVTSRSAVRRGDIVRLMAKGNGLTVSVRNCEALENGQEGEMIRIRNLSSKKTIAGRVVGIGEVEIAL